MASFGGRPVTDLLAAGRLMGGSTIPRSRDNGESGQAVSARLTAMILKPSRRPTSCTSRVLVLPTRVYLVVSDEEAPEPTAAWSPCVAPVNGRLRAARPPRHAVTMPAAEPNGPAPCHVCLRDGGLPSHIVPWAECGEAHRLSAIPDPPPTNHEVTNLVPSPMLRNPFSAAYDPIGLANVALISAHPPDVAE